MLSYLIYSYLKLNISYTYTYIIIILLEKEKGLRPCSYIRYYIFRYFLRRLRPLGARLGVVEVIGRAVALLARVFSLARASRAAVVIITIKEDIIGSSNS